jgi:signal transduction histidine kinase
METVKVSADSLLNVINDILDFSKIEVGKIDLEAIDFDLRECMESALKTVALRADEGGLELLLDVASDVPETVRGDSARLRQVLLNLLGNAIKFTHEGEVTLKVEVAPASAEGQTLHFTVSDTGIGIAPEKKGPDLRPVHPGGCIHHAAVRWDRPRIGDQRPPGDDDGGQDLGE